MSQREKRHVRTYARWRTRGELDQDWWPIPKQLDWECSPGLWLFGTKHTRFISLSAIPFRRCGCKEHQVQGLNKSAVVTLSTFASRRFFAHDSEAANEVSEIQRAGSRQLVCSEIPTCTYTVSQDSVG